ncbi:MAG: glycan-binding surface protein [Bacteroidota bacterium]
MVARIHLLLFSLALLMLAACRKEAGQPVIDNIVPTFGPAESLITIEGVNLGNIETVKFSDQIVNFNTAYNAENALLMRVPTNVPLGEHVVTITTEGGSVTTNFRVTLDPPEIFNFLPESAAPGEVVTVRGKNFFEPMTVWFFDSIQAELLTLTPDSLMVVVPEGVQKGRITMFANGGLTRSPIDFFSINPILVNDFDGNGLRSETNNWIFRGSIDQNRNTAVQNSVPAPIDGNYLKLSGTDELGISWIGGAENHTWDVEQFQTFGITANANNTLLEMDVHNNGRDNTHVILILLEKDGSPNDFAFQTKLDEDGWQRLSIPLNRFQDLNDFIVDPTKVKTVKIQLIDADNSQEKLEVNVDNIRFVEIS